MDSLAPAGGEGGGEGVHASDSATLTYPTTFLARVRALPPLVTEWGGCTLWPAQITAIRNLEASLAQNKPRALIQTSETMEAMARALFKSWFVDFDPSAPRPKAATPVCRRCYHLCS